MPLPSGGFFDAVDGMAAYLMQPSGFVALAALEQALAMQSAGRLPVVARTRISRTIRMQPHGRGWLPAIDPDRTAMAYMPLFYFLKPVGTC